MSWVRIWVHLVFSTKERYPFFRSEEIRKEVFAHIKQNAGEKDIWLDCVNGYKEHAHCLISLKRTQSVSQIAQLIKGESSIWINKQLFFPETFRWQDDFWAVGVSESHLTYVRNYIYSQESHHKRESFSDEINQFMQKYGWSYSNNNK